MIKLFNAKPIKVLLPIFIVLACMVFFHQRSLYEKYKGNFRLHVEYYGDLNKNCFDLLFKVNGKDCYRADSVGWCNNEISIAFDTVLYLPLGVNTIDISSEKLNLHFEDRVINLLYMYSNVEIWENHDINNIDTVKEMHVRYGYGRLELM